MKSTLNTWIAIFILGIIAMGFTNKPSTTHTILLQSADRNISAAMLRQSADVISVRLKSFCTETTDVSIFPESNQIQVIIPDEVDLKIVESLITQKGMLGFYETYDSRSLIQLLKGDSTLLELIHAKISQSRSAKLGCIAPSEISRVNRFLETLPLKGSCKFAWSNLFENSGICLYALRIAEPDRINLTGDDIQSFEAKYDTNRLKDYIDFKFKKPAVDEWAEATKRNIDKPIAIVMDNHVLYSPFVTEQINGGNCSISGDFSKTEVKYIVAIASGGVLPANFSVVK